MAKGDAKRDYYADLEVPNNADIAEIRRQFRRLGVYLPSSLVEEKNGIGGVYAEASGPKPLTDNLTSKLSNTTRTAILAMKTSSTPSSRLFSRPMRSLPTRSPERNMMQIGRG